MNGLHDVGGMHGFGPVRAPAAEPPFHCEAERRMFAVAMRLMGLGWCDADGFRHEVEKLPPRQLLREVFHENWLSACEAQLLAHGLLEPGELDRWMARPTAPTPAPAPPPLIPAIDESPLPARFQPGDRVRARNLNPAGHTRLPRYLRGREGRVEVLRGVFPFSDALAARVGRRPQPLYTVRFAARALWGAESSARDAVYVDLFDDYLEPAT